MTTYPGIAFCEISKHQPSVFAREIKREICTCQPHQARLPLMHHSKRSTATARRPFASDRPAYSSSARAHYSRRIIGCMPPLFLPFRAQGYITEDIPFATQRLGRETFVTVSVGNTWQVDQRNALFAARYCRDSCAPVK